MILLPHQETAAAWLSQRPRAYLGDGPRTGKTFPTVVATGLAGYDGADITILCPASAQPVWKSAWALLRPADVATPPKIASWEKYVRDKGVGYDAKCVILDEAHRTCNMASKTTKWALALAKRAETAWLLSGTPTPNHIGEIYTALLALWPEELVRLGVTDYESFLNKVAHWQMGDYGPRIFGLRDETLVQDIFKRIMLRRVEVHPPEIVEFPLEVTETGAMLDEVRKLEGEGLTMEEMLEQNNGQMATVRRLYGVAKVPAYLKLIADEGGKATPRVVFAYHHEVLHALKAGLERLDIRVAYVDGTTTPLTRESNRLGFMSGLYDVFVGQITANKEGIDLSRADVLDILEKDWTPGRNEQASMRIMNVAKNNEHKQVRHLYARGTIDEAVNSVTTRKSKGITQSGL